MNILKFVWLTETNCDIATERLKDRFRKLEDIGRAHYEELTKLQLVFSDKDTVGIIPLYDDVEFHNRTLQALRKRQDQYSDVFMPLIVSKLPDNIRVSVLSKKDQLLGIDKFPDMLGKEISIKEARRSQNH